MKTELPWNFSCRPGLRTGAAERCRPASYSREGGPMLAERLGSRVPTRTRDGQILGSEGLRVTQPNARHVAGVLGGSSSLKQRERCVSVENPLWTCAPAAHVAGGLLCADPGAALPPLVGGMGRSGGQHRPLRLGTRAGLLSLVSRDEAAEVAAGGVGFCWECWSSVCS